jgi:hypothetical protein
MDRFESWKRPPYPLVRRLGGPHSLAGQYGRVQVLGSARTPTASPRSPIFSQSLHDVHILNYCRGSFTVPRGWKCYFFFIYKMCDNTPSEIFAPILLVIHPTSLYVSIKNSLKHFSTTKSEQGTFANQSCKMAYYKHGCSRHGSLMLQYFLKLF